MIKEMSWENFIKNKAKKLYHYILKYVSLPEDAEDILQNSFLELFKNNDKVDEEYFEQWLYRVAHNKSVNHLKSQKVKRNKQKEISHTAEVFYEERFIDENEIKKQRIRACFQRMKEKQALALELQFYQNKSYKEIAEIMDMSISAVESLLVRAKKECRKILQETEAKNVI
jgi:RNA polymerase sigma-70 factor (ECF subfamily)